MDEPPRGLTFAQKRQKFEDLREEEVETLRETEKFVNSGKIFTGGKALSPKDVIQINFPGIVIDREIDNKTSIFYHPKVDVIARTCPLGMIQHSSNSIRFVFYKLSRKTFVRCFKCPGSIELTEGGNLYETVSKQVVKSSKKAKNCQPSVPNHFLPQFPLTNQTFKHDPILLSDKCIQDLYESLNFVYVVASKEQKRPLSSAWQKTVKSENVNFSTDNLAVVTGRASQIVVVDVDTSDDGLQWFQSMCCHHKFNYTTYTLCVQTPSGGLHVYFKYNERLSSNRVKMSTERGRVGIDVRSNNGCVVAPPSKYKNGSYSFICVKDVAELPPFLENVLVGSSDR